MGNRSAASSRAAERSAMMQQKRKTVDSVRVRFARFGDDVLSVVLAFALQPRTMPILMQRLNLRPSGTLDSQLDAIWEYIAQNSTKEFMKHVKRVEKRDVEKIDVEKLMSQVSKELSGSDASQVMDPPVSDAPVEPVAAAANEASSGEYTGVERRCGKDRRKHRDRRHDVEAVSSNRRYGGERRRNPRGRRKSDR